VHKDAKQLFYIFITTSYSLSSALIDGYSAYLNNSDSKRIKTIYYIVNGQLHTL
jgi:hypothetical protein